MNKNLSLAKTIVEKLGLPMKVFSVEENEEGVLTFHFSAENRVEMRELTKKLQEETKRKIMMHEVGAREEAQILSSVGPCGRRLCCATFLKTFPAFGAQDLKEGKEKMGACGKLICCLAFEERQVALEAAPSPQLPPIFEPVKPPPQHILRVLPRKKPRHRR